MANLLVLVEACADGIHPASALSLCVARDLASSKGATVIATALARSPQRDAQVMQEVTRRGADRLIFCESEQLLAMMQSLSPQCVLGPATRGYQAQLAQLGGEDLTIAWVQGPAQDPVPLEGPVALLAGSLPWYDLGQSQLIPEYPSDDQLCDLSGVPPASAPAAGSIRFVLDPQLDTPQLRAELALLKATELDREEALQPGFIGIYIGSTLPASVRSSQRWIMIPGDPNAPIQSDWGRAQWVLPGLPYDAIRSLHQQRWDFYLR